jgi:hypothetical protein
MHDRGHQSTVWVTKEHDGRPAVYVEDMNVSRAAETRAADVAQASMVPTQVSQASSSNSSAQQGADRPWLLQQGSTEYLLVNSSRQVLQRTTVAKLIGKGVRTAKITRDN